MQDKVCCRLHVAVIKYNTDYCIRGKICSQGEFHCLIKISHVDVPFAHHHRSAVGAKAKTFLADGSLTSPLSGGVEFHCLISIGSHVQRCTFPIMSGQSLALTSQGTGRVSLVPDQFPIYTFPIMNMMYTSRDSHERPGQWGRAAPGPGSRDCDSR